jgi:hypothetical protein
LNKVTEDRVKSALFEDLHGLTQHIQRLDTQVEHLANIHKLSSRVDTRKANSLSVLEEYPAVDASPAIFRQASAALLNLVKNIVTVKGLTIFKDSYSYILELAMSSNVISNQFILSESQQFSLLLDSLPANSSEFAVLNRCANLEDLFETISTFAPSIPTQRELENKIVNWKLDYRSVAHLNKSLTDLICWVEDVSDSDLNTVDIYHNVIGRILQEKVNSRILHNLQEIRMKISEQDRISDLVQMLLCPLKQLIPKTEHTPKSVQKTENVSHSTPSSSPNDYPSSPRSIAYLQDPNTLMQVSYFPPGYVPPAVNAVNSNTQEKKVGKYAERNKKRRERKALEKQVNAITQQKTDQTQQTMSSVPKTTVTATEKPNDLPRLKRFVDPWPENKPYLNKSGNALSAEFEKAFEAFCFKCGHISHKGQDCRIYPDQTAFLTLCSKCRQGLHDECKSRRKFYPKQNINQLQSYFQRDGLRNFYPPYPMWGGFNNVTMPYGDFGHLGQSERPRLQPITED